MENVQPGAFILYNRPYCLQQAAIGRVGLSSTCTKETHVHIQEMVTSAGTILGDDHKDTNELFGTRRCFDIEKTRIVKTLVVASNGEVSMDVPTEERIYVCKLFYNNGTFVTPVVPEDGKCVACHWWESERTMSKMEIRHVGSPGSCKVRLYHQGNRLKVGTFFAALTEVTLCPGLTLIESEEVPPPPLKNNDYPEAWRWLDPSERKEPKFTQICRVEAIVTKEQCKSDQDFVDKIKLKVRIFVRSCEVGLGDCKYELISTDTVGHTKIKNIMKILQVQYAHENMDVKKWIAEGLGTGVVRFVYKQHYNNMTSNKKLKKIEALAQGDLYSSIHIKDHNNLSPLTSLDLFSGCGGLTKGLEESGLAICKWAVEMNCDAAASFRKNFPGASVFNQDLKAWFRYVKRHPEDDEHPKPGEVGVVCGGSPCQGFSRMNRHRDNDKAKQNNKLAPLFFRVATYFNPDYIIYENVRTLTCSQNTPILQGLLHILVQSGYQFRLGIVSAAGFGIPQKRQRTIILAAKLNKKLPDIPEELYCSPSRNYSCRIGTHTLHVTCDNARMYPQATIKDAMYDLSGVQCSTGFVKCNTATSPLQVKLQDDRATTNLHYEVSSRDCLDNERIKRIKPGGDWRHLPNIALALRGRIVARRLKYNKLRRKFQLVCPCREKKKCTVPRSKSLIPWCLAHRADTNGHFGGAYGRLRWTDLVQTVLTKPSPLRAGGAIVHPREGRYLTVRECARLQSFPDNFAFCGTRDSILRQIGNAVPPLLALALGHSVKKNIAS